MTENSLIANISRVRGFDLNLLLNFEAIYVHKSVSKAAELLCVSPSAVSQSLTKLRSFFSDPLFVREGRGLVATTVAENLHTQLRAGFGQLLNSLDYFKDTATKNKFVIHSTPYAALRILPKVSAEILNEKLNCEISHISTDALLDTIEDALTYRKADIVFDTKPYYNFSTVVEPYLVERTVPICRKDHPRLDTTLTFEEMALETSTLLNAGSENIKRTQTGIMDFLGERNFFFSSSSIIVNAAIVENSDVVSFVPVWFAEKFASSFNIKVLDCNFCPEPVTMYITYNKASLKSPHFQDLLEILNKYKEI
ncbi:LysR family transcriptional regulator [Buttiauxella gaviniae]|uniref:LysR family transcriptional regulator n=1 Tax=Buttiauxella gaviniae TaxID=82990 RepID=A0ABV3NYA9_9ENTR